jgi:hypothetical protein
MLSTTFTMMLSAIDKRENEALRERYDSSSNTGYEHPMDKWSKLMQVLTNTNVLFSIIVGTWLFLGMIVYVYSNNWAWHNAFYHSVETGFSIGFGSLVESSTPQMRLFTMGYVLWGSSVVSGAFGYFLRCKLFLSGEKAFRARLHVPVTEEKGIVLYYWDRLKIAIGWFSNRGFVRTAMLFTFWIALGIIYGMCYEKWDFVTALYFAITTCSSGGFIDPPCNNPEFTNTKYCDFSVGRATLVGIYVLFGAPRE